MLVFRFLFNTLSTSKNAFVFIFHFLFFIPVPLTPINRICYFLATLNAKPSEVRNLRGQNFMLLKPSCKFYGNLFFILFLESLHFIVIPIEVYSQKHILHSIIYCHFNFNFLEKVFKFFIVFLDPLLIGDCLDQFLSML